jgi:predicted O-methyltransferase YrrM
MRISRIHKYILDIIDKKRRPYYERRALKNLQENKGLYRTLSEFIDKTEYPPGASYFDYWILYQYVRVRQPKEVLECGAGVTTVVLAYAMDENEKEGRGGHITSMEEHKEYYNDVLAHFPDHLKKQVDFVLSPKVEGYFGLFRGVRYRDVPDKQYDFVYIDGPTTKAPSDGHKTFDFDFVRVVERSLKPVFALVDTRMSTCWALAHLLNDKKVLFDYVYEVGIVGPCTKNDLRTDWNGFTKGLGPRPIKGGNLRRMLSKKD